MPPWDEGNWTQSQTNSQTNQWGSFAQDFSQMGITDPMSSGNVQSALSSMFGRQVPKGMVSALTPGMMKGMQFGTYRPMLEQQTSSLLTDLTKSLGGKEAGKAYGGFSGTSSSGLSEQKSKDVYGQKAGKVLQDIGQMQTGARRSIMDIVSQWRMAGQAIK